MADHDPDSGDDRQMARRGRPSDRALRESEARLRTVLEGIGEAFYVLDRDWRFVFVSRSALKMWGKSSSDISGRPFLECFPKAADTEPYKAHQRVMETGAPERLETISPIIGRWIEIDLTIAPMGGLSVAFRDIHARKLAEIALRESEERLRQALEAGRMEYWEWDPGTDRVVRSNSLRDLDGLNPDGEGHGGEESFVLVHPDDRERHQAMVKAAGRNGQGWRTQVRIIRPSTGEVGWMEERAVSTVDPVTGEKRIVGFIWDITERKQAEAMVRGSEERQAFLLKLSDALRSLADPVDIQLKACQILGELTGVNRVLYGDVIDEKSVVIARNYVDGVDPIVGTLDADAFGAETVAAYKRQERVIFTDIATDPRFSEDERKNYAAIGVAANVSVGLVKGGRWVAAMGLHNATPRQWSDAEITLLEDTAERTWAAVERACAEAALRDSEEKYRTIFDTIDSGYAVVTVVRNDDGRVIDLIGVEFNRAYEAVCGVPPFPGRRVTEVVHMEADWLGHYDKVAHTGVSVRSEDYVPDTDRWISAHFSLVGALGSDRIAVVFDDITQRKRAEIALRDSEARKAFLLKLSDDGPIPMKRLSV